MKVRSLRDAQKFQSDVFDKEFRERGNPFQKGGVYGDIYGELAFEKRIKLAMDFLSDQGREIVLDLGCGDGTVTQRVARKAKRVIGIDVSRECIKYARKYNNGPNVEYLNIPIENYDFPLEFDLILLYEVIEHLYNPKLILKKCNESLKDIGILILSTPNQQCLIRRIARIPGVRQLCNKFTNRDPDDFMAVHFKEYSWYEVISMLARAGFEVIKEDGITLLCQLPYDILSKLTNNRFFHKINLYSGSLVPSLAETMYLVARKKLPGTPRRKAC